MKTYHIHICIHIYIYSYILFFQLRCPGQSWRCNCGPSAAIHFWVCHSHTSRFILGPQRIHVGGSRSVLPPIILGLTLYREPCIHMYTMNRRFRIFGLRCWAPPVTETLSLPLGESPLLLPQNGVARATMQPMQKGVKLTL